jgi:hypothetical protein
MRGFERLQLVHQGVELRVRDLGILMNVVPFFVVPDALAENSDPFDWVGHARGGTNAALPIAGEDVVWQGQ